MNKTVDVIIPVYNTAPEYLRQSILSVLSQTYDKVHAIIVDDGSTLASTLDTLKEFENNQKITIIRKRNSGVSSARNTGLEFSFGDYVLFLDSDDKIENQYLENLVTIMREKHCNIVFSGIVDPATKKNNAPFFKKMINLDCDMDTIILKNQSFVCCGALISGQLARSEKFDTNLSMGEDTIYIVQLMKKGKTFYDGNGGYMYRQHSKNTSSCQNLKLIGKYLDDTNSMVDIFENNYNVNKNTITLFRLKKMALVLKFGIKQKKFRGAVNLVLKSKIYQNRKRISDYRIIKDKNTSAKNKIVQILINDGWLKCVGFLLLTDKGVTA